MRFLNNFTCAYHLVDKRIRSHCFLCLFEIHWT